MSGLQGAQTSPLAGHGRILVVDSSPEARGALLGTLTGNGPGFDVQGAQDESEAQALVQQGLQAQRPYALAFVGVSSASGWAGLETAVRIWALDPAVQIVCCIAPPDIAADIPLARLGIAHNSSQWVVLPTPADPVAVAQWTRVLIEKWHLQRRTATSSGAQAPAATADAPGLVPPLPLDERDLLTTLMENSPDSIYFKDLESRLVKVSRSEVHNLLRLSISRYRADHPETAGEALPQHLCSVEAFEKYVIGKTDADIYGHDRASEFSNDEAEILRTGKPIVEKSERTVHPDGRVVWYLTTKGPWRDRNGRLIGTFGTSKNMTQLKEAERKIEEVQAQLLTAARLAGMAEVATNVLHNVGNVLNSVNVSADLIGTRLRASRLKGLARSVDLMDAHAADLGEFLTRDSRGKLLPAYLRELARALEEEHLAIAAELGTLCSSVDHIKQVIATQQSYAGSPRMVESARVIELLDDALRINAGALTRHKVEVVKNYSVLPALLLDRHRVLQVLVNLISNAKQALDALEDRRPVIHIDAALADSAVLRIAVTDNGEGIAPENLTRVFSHGFTTRKNGHGFGLHSCVLAAQEMGGSLRVHSAGPGQGATFTLEIPVAPAPAH